MEGIYTDSRGDAICVDGHVNMPKDLVTAFMAEVESG